MPVQYTAARLFIPAISRSPNYNLSCKISFLSIMINTFYIEIIYVLLPQVIVRFQSRRDLRGLLRDLSFFEAAGTNITYYAMFGHLSTPSLYTIQAKTLRIYGI